jgi:hypothetical protein
MRVAIALGLVVALVGDVRRAEACGCLSPPAVTEGDYAVNQEAEQIIFEAEPGWVTAHVMIRYAGDPAQFAWIVPVPEVPELGVSPASTFALLDQLSAPQISITTEDICPRSEWACQYHAPLSCPGDDNAGYPGYGIADASAGFGDAAPGGSEPPVTVISTQVVGDYQTVTFRASEASAAVQWLRDNGFIVNQTTSIYMESYIAANMVFVAAKLVPGAGVKAIKPLKLRYRAAHPTVPLILTAVAAEPNLTVNTFIYSSAPFRPLGHPVVTIDPNRLATDRLGRSNYPMVLSRAIDEAGGDGFAIEYRGYPVTSQIGTSNCCIGGADYCHVGGNGQCECPNADFDAADCAATGDLPDGLALLSSLATKYPALTRITTRVSPEEMTFDPAFEADDSSPSWFGNLYVNGTQPSLNACGAAVLDQAKLKAINDAQQCASVYCGPHGQCVATTSGPACQCAADYVAQQFTDLDTQPSVTCVPRVPPVDLRADGIQLPDACGNVSCGAGQCIDRNGEAVCACNDGAAATVAIGAAAPTCAPVTSLSGSPGAQDFSEELRGLAVCAPRPPVCGPDGWLAKVGTAHPGVDCGDSQPDPALTREPAAPTCPGLFSCNGCDTPGSSAPIGSIAAGWLVALVVLRRRRRA